MREPPTSRGEALSKLQQDQDRESPTFVSKKQKRENTTCLDLGAHVSPRGKQTEVEKKGRVAQSLDFASLCTMSSIPHSEPEHQGTLPHASGGFLFSVVPKSSQTTCKGHWESNRAPTHQATLSALPSPASGEHCLHSLALPPASHGFKGTPAPLPHRPHHSSCQGHRVRAGALVQRATQASLVCTPCSGPLPSQGQLLLLGPAAPELWAGPLTAHLTSRFHRESHSSPHSLCPKIHQDPRPASGHDTVPARSSPRLAACPASSPLRSPLSSPSLISQI